VTTYYSKEYFVNDKYQRAKQFYRKHHTVIVYGAGVIAGAVGTYKLTSNNASDLFLAVSPENLQKLIDKPGGALKWTAGRTNIFVLNEANPIV
jgi:hypothetical protein